jgi:hypothetical protein
MDQFCRVGRQDLFQRVHQNQDASFEHDFWNELTEAKWLANFATRATVRGEFVFQLFPFTSIAGLSLKVSSDLNQR